MYGTFFASEFYPDFSTLKVVLISYYIKFLWYCFWLNVDVADDYKADELFIRRQSINRSQFLITNAKLILYARF